MQRLLSGGRRCSGSAQLFQRTNICTIVLLYKSVHNILLYILDWQLFGLTLSGPPVGDDVSAVGVDNVKLAFALESVDEPADIDLLEPLAVVVKGLPVALVLVPAKIGVAVAVRALAAIVPGPRRLANHGRQADVVDDPLCLPLDVSPGVVNMAVPVVVEGHGVDVCNIRVVLDALAHVTETSVVAVAHAVGAVPVLADTDGDAKALEAAAQLAQVDGEVLAVHAVTDGLGAELDRVHNIRSNRVCLGVVDGVVDGLLGLSPFVLLPRLAWE